MSLSKWSNSLFCKYQNIQTIICLKFITDTHHLNTCLLPDTWTTLIKLNQLNLYLCFPDSVMCSDANPLHCHDERRPLVVLRVDPVDLSSVGQCLRHVRQAAGTWGPVELKTLAVLFGLVENHLLTGWRRRQCGGHGHGWSLSSLWKMGG